LAKLRDETINAVVAAQEPICPTLRERLEGDHFALVYGDEPQIARLGRRLRGLDVHTPEERRAIAEAEKQIADAKPTLSREEKDRRLKELARKKVAAPENCQRLTCGVADIDSVKPGATTCAPKWRPAENSKQPIEHSAAAGGIHPIGSTMRAVLLHWLTVSGCNQGSIHPSRAKSKKVQWL
jgi:hypothetical protein